MFGIPAIATIKGTWIAIVGGMMLVLLLGNIAQAVNTYGDLGFKGPLGIGFHFQGWKPRALADEGTIKAMKKASDDNAKAQKKANDDQKAAFNAAAEKANATYEAQLAVARSAADRYKLAHRVQPGTASVSPGTTTAKGDPAKPPEAAAARTGVVISDQSFDACTVDYTYSKQVYDWAQDLVSKGTAEFGP